MAPIRYLIHPFSDSHSTGSANEGRTRKLWWGSRRQRNPGLGGGGAGGGSTGEEERPNAIAYNKTYVEGRWGLFWHARVMRLITQTAILAGVELPSSPVYPQCKACPTFHIKGMCNMVRDNITDHAAHTQE